MGATTLPKPLAGAAALAVAGAAILALLATILLGALGGSLPGQTEITTYGVSALASRTIPPAYLRLYQAAAQRYGLDWAILAGIGRVETDHGRLKAPGVTSGVNSYGCCAGPMQFSVVPPHPTTWDQFGVDGNGDGRRSPYDPADAIPAAARYLRASGAPGDYRQAIFAYNHANWYVAQVLSWAARYRGALHTVALSAPLVAGSRASLSSDARVGRAPLAAPLSVRRMIAAGNRLQGVPYGPAGHPDPVNAPSQDCSSSTSYVLFRGGRFGRSAFVSSQFLRFGRSGPGRWVTVWARPGVGAQGHVFVVLAGLRLDTNYGYDTGPNAGLRGPRWRLGPFPERAQGYTPRHPAGL